MPETLHRLKHILIKGSGIAGQVLHRELGLRHIPSQIEDYQQFPRQKVCGGVLQPDSWKYLNSIFDIKEKHSEISHISHFWKGKRISRIRLDEKLIFISRFTLDQALKKQEASFPVYAVKPQTIWASGVGREEGEWIGFQARTDLTTDLEMHYAPNLYLGLAPAPEGYGHAALLVRRKYLKNPTELQHQVKQDLGVNLEGPFKGTGRIHYGYTSREFAVGDAKFTTHPFLGLGMKHAILSSRLMADLIEQGKLEDYSRLHRKYFATYRRINWMTERLYTSRMRCCIWPILRYRSLFMPAYHWAHK